MHIITGQELIKFFSEIAKAHRVGDIKASTIFKQYCYFTNGTETSGVHFHKNEILALMDKWNYNL